jgi:ATP-dependent RNA helicase DDX49/DBP8
MARVLISTDVASRGLDIPEVTHVINFDLPRDADDYIHRVGRTARAGRKGESVSIVTQHDIELLQNIEKTLEKPMENYESEAPEPQVLKMLKDVTTATRVAKMKMTEHGFDDRVQRRKKQRATNITKI